jgi:hypothetical protein
LRSEAARPKNHHIKNKVKMDNNEDNYLTRHEAQDSESEYDKAMRKNIQVYPEWQEKFSTWTWQKIMQKLRDIGISTSRAEFEDIAETCQSAYQLSNVLLDRMTIPAKTLHHLGVFWAACEALWERFLPDFLNVEMFLKKIDDVAYDIIEYKNIMRMPEFLELYAAFIEDVIGDSAPIKWEEIYAWYSLEENWLDNIFTVFQYVLQTYGEETGDIHLAGFRFLEDFERDGIISDIMEHSSAFILYKIWSNFVNGNEAETAKNIAYFEQHFEPTEKFYELLADLYKKPPVYTYTPANEIKYLEYSSKMLNFIGK